MTTHILYGGTVALSFDDKSHSYVVDGEKIISVTQVEPPKPQLIWWAAREAAEYVQRTLVPGVPLDEIAIAELCDAAKKAHRDKSSKAASIGTLAHKACETYAKTGVAEVPVNKEAARAFESFVEWFKKHKVKVHASESKVYSKRYKYAGTCDLFCEVDGEPCVTDLKTSSQIYPEMSMQLSAYANAKNEELNEQVYETGWIVRLPKDGGEAEIKRYTGAELVKAFRAFEGLLAFHQWVKG